MVPKILRGCQSDIWDLVARIEYGGLGFRGRFTIVFTRKAGIESQWDLFDGSWYNGVVLSVAYWLLI